MRTRGIFILVLAGLAATAIVIFIKPIFHAIWSTIRELFDGIFRIIDGLFNGICWIFEWLTQTVLIVAASIPMWAVQAAGAILAALVPLAALAVVLLCICAGLWLAIRQFKLLASQIAATSADARQAAIDAGVVATLAAGVPVVAYVATNEFLGKLHTLSFLAVATMSCCTGKTSLIIPTVPAKLIGGTIIAVAVVVTGLFLWHQYGLVSFWGATPSRQFAFLVIMLLFTASAGYPFTIGGWKRLLKASPSTSAN